MKALVIGGSRYFGRKLVNNLLLANHEVTLLNRQSVDDGLQDKVKRILCDRRDSKALATAVGDESWDIIYDQVCYNAAEAKAACEVFRGKTPHYVFTSSQSVYERGSSILEETFLPNKYKFSEDPEVPVDYSEGKRQAEAVFFSMEAFPLTAVRFSIVVGGEDYTGRFKWHVDRIKSDADIYFPNPHAKISLIHATDAASVLEFLIESPPLGALNAASPFPIRLKDLFATIEESLEKTGKIATDLTENNHSPFGAKSDWYMNTDKLFAKGLHTNLITEWLPQLVRELR